MQYLSVFDRFVNARGYNEVLAGQTVGLLFEVRVELDLIPVGGFESL